MHEPAVPDVHFGRLHQPLAGVGDEGWQSPDQQQISQEIDVAGDHRRADGQARGQRRGVQQGPLGVSEHPPQPFQRGSGDRAGRELRDVALQVGGDEVQPVRETVGVVGGKEALREAAAQPQSSESLFVRRRLENIEGMKRYVCDAPRQALARLPQQVHGGRAQDQKPACAPASTAPGIDEATELTKQLRRAMDLVDDHQTGRRTSGGKEPGRPA